MKNAIGSTVLYLNAISYKEDESIGGTRKYFFRRKLTSFLLYTETWPVNFLEENRQSWDGLLWRKVI